MANFRVNEAGEVDDRVRIVLGDGEPQRIVEGYELSQRVFQQPSAFTLRLGSGERAQDIIRRARPNTRYQLFIGDVLQQSGRVDAYGADPGTGATEITIRGRDALAALMDDHISADRGFSNVTFVDLIVACIEGAGISAWSLRASNDANRLAIAGAQARGATFNAADVAATAAGSLLRNNQVLTATVASLEAALSAEHGPEPLRKPQLQARAGSTWWEFLRPELERSGFFLFAAANPDSFVVMRPKGDTPPLYSLYRQRGAPVNAVNVLAAAHTNDTTGRHTQYVVRGRAGGTGVTKAARSQFAGEYVDEEMREFGFRKRLVIVDDKAKNESRAELLARRKCAEERRQGWKLVYTVRGHTTPLLGLPANATERAVWTVDTTVQVRDDEFGIQGTFYIEGVEMRGGSSGTTTELTLARPEDLVFGPLPKETKARAGKAGRVTTIEQE